MGTQVKEYAEPQKLTANEKMEKVIEKHEGLLQQKEELIEFGAMMLHEANRNLIENHADKLITSDKKIDFIGWEGLTLKQREGKKIVAEWLLEHGVRFNY